MQFQGDHQGRPYYGTKPVLEPAEFQGDHQGRPYGTKPVLEPAEYSKPGRHRILSSPLVLVALPPSERRVLDGQGQAGFLA